MDWAALAATSTAIMTFIVLAAACLAVWQIREIRKQRSVEAFVSVVEILQAEDVREARHTLLTMPRKKLDDWTEEEKKAAEKVCSTYDTVGLMVYKGLVKPDMVAHEWRDSIVKCWEAAHPMISKYSDERGRDYWDDFKRLYERAEAIKPPRNNA